MSGKPKIALALHGGGGAKKGRDYSKTEAHMAELCAVGRKMLEEGARALDAVEALIVAMEGSGLYVAGRGSGPNQAGYVELDAAIMESTSPNGRQAGAVAAVAHLRNPIRAARVVMEQTPHILLAGRGAENFCRARGLAFIDDPASYYVTPIGVVPDEMRASGQGTVGAVALDGSGRLAAGSSTGGTFGKLEGRVGDTPLIGAAAWADENVAVSCTGIGEKFILAGGSHNLASRVRYQRASLHDAAEALIQDVGRFEGWGGVIAVSRDGDIAFAWNSEGMKRAGFGAGQPLFAATF
jgi:beta-aspartyl-peptidase (threonine type)